MKLFNFTIIKLTCFLIIGIIISYFYPIPISLNLYLCFTLLVLLFISILIARKQFIKSIWFGIIAYVLMIFVGVLTTSFHNQKNAWNHYSKCISIEKDSLKTVTFRIREVLKPGNYYDKYVIDVLKINNETVSGKSLLNIQKDSTQSTLKVDEIIVGNLGFQNLIHPLNPHQFDYKKYLEKKYIYHQIFTKNEYLLKLSSDTHTLIGIANDIREYINLKLKPYHFKPDELAIINALLLGQRQDISKEVYTSYTNAGAIHILAVSGLHVGIILLILTQVFKPIERFKHGKLIKAILLVSCLWSFALIAGLSASVTRAVTMFSIVAIAMNLKRPTNVYNTLAISMFVILLFKPLFLFDVGFQLSYLAVFAIVAIDPLLYNLWRPKNWFLDKYWHTLTITVSAQFGIIPISLYYFHQFPGLFFISNLVIIPFLGLILGLGILVILLATINLLPSFFAEFYGYIISGMNSFVAWVSKQETFLLKDIAFNLLYVFVSYLLIITLIKFLKKRSFVNLKLLLIAVLIFQCAFIYTAYKTPTNQFIVFHKSRNTLLGNHTNKNLLVAHDFDSITQSSNKIIRDFTVGNYIKTIKKDTLKSIYILNNKKLLVIDSLGVYNIKSFHPDYVLLRQSPKINLNRLIDSIKPKHIIADGSNYKSYVEGWEAICLKRKLPFHQTSKKGAFIINY
ncbi:competence protein ComEC family protein [Sabulilitoribacter arenilitoris]|uniref:Competence protein ComEC family protein n=1 Tax=Wocania arenilitoris TaxID=2044858 RepID=A0AAE3JMB8_9FLAO|nr:ComEC/Rec2 family competence protein [Wocania arenilitoris]MCF7567606.1 competence protein ComEC family protein [Wocania arenilitoris]